MTEATMTTRLFSSARCLDHDPPGFPERAARLGALLAHWQRSGLEVEEVGRHERSAEAVEAVHDPGYVARLRRAVARGDGLVDSADNPLTPNTWNAAIAAVEAGLAAVDWVMEGAGRRAFAAVRPPGHHAERARAMGFCYLGNVAVAAQHLLDVHGCERVAIFDFDVHHGNGTQHLFEERCDVFFASTHQYPFYPGTGAEDERGRGRGTGCTLNVPLAAGAGDAELERALDDAVLPALAAFDPEFLLVSAGFDAWRSDPLGGLRWTEGAYSRLGTALRAVAEEVCEGRMAGFLEGGYDVAALPTLVDAYLGR